MLVFASICPHPPIIIPEIGKENLKIVKKTVEGLKKLAETLKAAKPEVILIISPHGPILENTFTMNLTEKFFGNFEGFGDFITKMEFASCPELVYKISELITQFPLITVSQPALDHGTTVPLYYLTKELKNFSIVPLTPSFLNLQKHFDFGQSIKEIISRSKKRIALIASGDLSHRLTFDAPAGYSPRGKIFDEKLVSLLKTKRVNEILSLDEKLIEEAGECGLRPIVFLLGTLEDINWTSEILSYEGPFGVGYLVANFKLP